MKHFKLMKYKIVNPFSDKPLFLHVCSKSLLKTLREKEKLLITSNFSFSHSVFYPFWRIFHHFHQIQNYRLQTLSVWKSLKFVVWERLRQIYRRAKYMKQKSGCVRARSVFINCSLECSLSYSQNFFIFRRT